MKTKFMTLSKIWWHHHIIFIIINSFNNLFTNWHWNTFPINWVIIIFFFFITSTQQCIKQFQAIHFITI